jgi:stress response protein YsnF
MQHTVIGIFNNSEDAQRAVEQLRSTGFPESNIDIVSSHRDSHTRSGVTSNTNADSDSPYGVTDESRYNQEKRSDLQDRDVLNGDRINERKGRDEHDEGIGDSIGRFFRNLFDNREEAEKYASAGRLNTIVSIHAPSSEEAVRVADILDTCGAIDIDERTTETGTYTSAAQRSSHDSEYRDERGPEGVADRDDTTDKTIPIVEEDASIGKREVETGGVRVRSRIVERPVEDHLRLREEHIYVERNPVNRPATERDLDTFREGEIEITETSEVPIVNKEARVVEEVRLRKEIEERDETIRDTVKKTDVEVDKLENKRPRRQK